jgi:histidinol dehydrogenase
MPLEVLDLRQEVGLPDRVRRHGGWDRPELAKPMHEVQRILADVREDGDDALIAYTHSFDGAELDEGSLRVDPDERDIAAKRVEPKVLDALRAAADNIRAFHEAQRPQSWTLERDGISVGQVFRPIRRVGLYAPGGRGAYPSTVLMTAIPAQVAGVPEIALCTPPDHSGLVSDVILAAAQVAGIDEIYRIGGAQAIGAMAYGTDTIRPCDKISGPGNIYVTLAKREVYGICGIDGLFGPSESVVVADGHAKPVFVAAELLTQAEHDPEASAILVTTSEELMGAAVMEAERRLRRLPRVKEIRESLAMHGLALLVRDLDQAAEVVNHLAPEHLCVHVADPDGFLEHVEASGCVLLGEATPAALSDYCAGPSHVLPTARTARFSSGLGVRDFLVGLNTVRYDRQALFREAPLADSLAEAEGLQAHREDIRVRLEDG